MTLALNRIDAPRTKVGLVAGGLGAYWPQFPDLLPQLQRSAARVSERMRGARLRRRRRRVHLRRRRRAPRAAEQLRVAGCDLIVGFLTTYMTATMLVPIAQRSGAPVLLINLQPTESMDHATFDTGQWLAYCGACPLPEMANTFQRAGIDFRSVSGYLEDERAWARIGRWIKAAGVRGALRHGRHGLMGHLYPGMLDVSTDLTLIPANFGGHVEVLEFDDLRVRVDAGDRRRRSRNGSRWPGTVFELDPTRSTTTTSRWAAQVSVGLDRLVDDFALDSLAYYHRGLDGEKHERLGAGMILGASLLTARGDPRGGRVRAAHLAGHAHHGPARRRRLVHRIPGAGLPATASSRWATTARPTSRSARSGRCCAGWASTTASAAGACRSSSTSTHGPVTAFGLAAAARRRASASSPPRARSVDGPAAADRQHHLAGGLRLRPRRVDRRLERDRHLAPLGAGHRAPRRRTARDGRSARHRDGRGESLGRGPGVSSSRTRVSSGR